MLRVFSTLFNIFFLFQIYDFGLLNFINRLLKFLNQKTTRNFLVSWFLIRKNEFKHCILLTERKNVQKSQAILTQP